MTRAWNSTGEIDYLCLTPVSEYVDSPNLVGVTFRNGEMLPDPRVSFPATREEVYRFDVMLISDVPVGNFSAEQMEWVVDWVLERGAGFLMGGGYTTFDIGHYDQTPWEKIIPVDITAYGDGFYEQFYGIDLPESVLSHPLWRISDDPEENNRILDAHCAFTGMNRVRRAKPGALVLATRRCTNGEPVIAAQRYGRGRSVAFLPDPNGGWAKYYVSWGAPEGTVQGPQTELGHGENFRFKEDSANAAKGPMPPHPAPYNAKYRVVMVRWLVLEMAHPVDPTRTRRLARRQAPGPRREPGRPASLLPRQGSPPRLDHKGPAARPHLRQSHQPLQQLAGRRPRPRPRPFPLPPTGKNSPSPMISGRSPSTIPRRERCCNRGADSTRSPPPMAEPSN